MKNKLLLFFVLFSVIAESYSQVGFEMEKDTLSEFNIQVVNRPKLSYRLFKANNFCIAYNLTMFGWLLVVPESVSKWDLEVKLNGTAIREQYCNSYSKPPVYDNDMPIVNYLGHPYQGAFYYNTLRSQGSTILESSLFCLGQSLLWEYVYEAGMEQPSIQDLITTPIIGALSGELIHRATLKMGKGGYKWYEKIFVYVFNPSFALNNKLAKSAGN